MTKITVYPFKYYDPKNDNYKMGQGMATEDEINRIEGAVALTDQAKEIDDSGLTRSNRYYDPDSDA